MEIPLTKQAEEGITHALKFAPRQLEQDPLRPVALEQLARAHKHLGNEEWRAYCNRAIEVRLDDLAHPRPSGDPLGTARWFLWAGEPDRARPHLERLVAWNDSELDRRPNRTTQFDYFIALIFLGRLDRLLEAAQHPTAEGGKLLPAVVGVIEADRAGDRKRRDQFAHQITALSRHDMNQRHWYQALSTQMTAKPRFGRSAALPEHPPSPNATSDYQAYRVQFGEDAVATQLRAAQSGAPVNTAVALARAAELEAETAMPTQAGSSALMSLAGLYRMADDHALSDQLLTQVLTQSGSSVDDRSCALALLGRHDELTQLIQAESSDDITDGVLAYSAIADGEPLPHLDDLFRWATKQCPAETGVSVWYGELLDLATARFGTPADWIP